MYDTVRPLLDSEMPQAMQAIAASPMLAPIARFIYPGQSADVLAEKLRAVATADDLQTTVMHDAIRRIVDTTIGRFTFSGIDRLDPAKPSLFISNHRDITLDAFLLAYALYLNNPNAYQRLYITFGSNLMQDPLVTLIGRANRMFRVERGGTPKEFYRNMATTSAYIRHVVTVLNHSVWIAQRNGRTKDGRDRTEPSLLKMLALSGRAYKSDPLAPLRALNIVPVSISYQYEPCDRLKARELHLRSLGPYSKQPGEDLNSVLSGIQQQKGDVNIAVTEPLSSEEIDLCSATDTPFENLAAAIDRRILTAYALHDTNYLAFDLLHNTHAYADRYTDTLRKQFVQRLPDDPVERGIMLQIYGNPLENH